MSGWLAGWLADWLTAWPMQGIQALALCRVVKEED
jgi:hypothetical protein